MRNRAALAAKKKKKSKTTSDSDDEEHNPSEKNKPKNLHDEDPAFSGCNNSDGENKPKNLHDEDPALSGGSGNDSDDNLDDEFVPSVNETKKQHDEDPTCGGGSKEDGSDSDNLVADTDDKAEFSEMEDAAANEDEDYPKADPELVLLDVSKKESALEKAIPAAGLVAKDEVRLDDDVEDEGCIWCGDVREYERKLYVTESMNERNLIFDDIDSLKRHATYFLHPKQLLCVDPLLMAQNYFDHGSAPQPVPQPASDVAPADDDATAFKGSDSASAKEAKVQSAKADTAFKGSDSASVKETKGQSASSPEKTGRGNRKRPAGHRPETALQQGDADVRLRLDGVQLPMERLQTMTIPVTRSDKTTAELEAENAHEKDWAWVIHRACCYTEQQPNEDGQKSAPGKLGTLELHFWAGLEQSKDHLFEMLSEVTTNVKVHGSFNSHKRAFRSSSGMAKPAPPVKKKKLNHRAPLNQGAKGCQKMR